MSSTLTSNKPSLAATDPAPASSSSASSPSAGKEKPLAPGYINPSLFFNSNFVLESGDIVVATPVKSGTHFGLQLVYQMISGCDFSFECIYDRVQWLEFKNFKEQTDEERCAIVKGRKREKTGFRLFKSHMPIPPVPILPHVKYIFVLRDTREMAVSIFHFFNSHNPEFWAYWDFDGTLSTLDDAVTLMAAAPFTYPCIQSYWQQRHNPNCLLLSFTNMVKNLPKEVARVRQFLGISLSASELATVIHNTCFTTMKQHETKFEPFNIGPIVNGKPIPPLVPGALIRKGANDHGNSTLSIEQKQRIEEFDEKFLSKECIEFIRNGGEIQLEKPLATQ